jgi:hypothetical protein
MTGVDAVRQVGEKATARRARAEAAQVGVKMTRSIVDQQGAHAPPIPKVLGMPLFHLVSPRAPCENVGVPSSDHVHTGIASAVKTPLNGYQDRGGGRRADHGLDRPIPKTNPRPRSLSAQSLQVAQASAGHLPEAEHLEPPPTVE